MGPLATWLQVREAWLPVSDMPDAFYLVAGAEDQDLRLAALTGFLEGRPADGPKTVVLIGNDTHNTEYLPEAGRKVTMAERARRTIDAVLGSRAGSEIVPGQFWGTDGEMEALAAHLRGRPQIHRLALVTSPFHARRAMERLRARGDPSLRIAVLPAAGSARDRCPWTVASELAKITRDRLGWSRAALLSRHGWRDLTGKTAR
jgi:hypothetical protein